MSGQGVKLRDRSNSNEFTGNTFEKRGWYAYYYEQFCDAACLGGSGAGKARECASYANRFTNTIWSPTRGADGPQAEGDL